MTDFFSPKPGAEVLVLGDVILDRYLHGDAQRISPEAPVPIIKVESTEERPGGAANVAINIKSMGVGTQLLGVTGNDADADNLEQLLNKADVHCDFVRQSNYETVTKVRVLSQHQQLLRLDYETHIENLNTESLYKRCEDTIKHCDLLLLSDYAKGSLSLASDYISLAKRLGIPVLIDPKGNDFSRYEGADLITPNLKEFEAIVGKCDNDEQIVEKAHKLCKNLSIDRMLITRGERGMTAVDGIDNTSWHVPALAHEVFDVTGAGDTVIAVLAASLASSYTFQQSVQFANLAAGLVVEKLGAASVTVDEINSKIRHTQINNSPEVILEPENLLATIELARSRNERIVMTNGCFDILHAGHVNYLDKARAAGDRLLVAVNDDDSVRRLKGAGRPINKLNNRMKVLAGLESTSWVTSFGEDTPEELIKLVKPDFLVKGADYEISEIAGADFVLSYGGEVLTISFEDDCSTTDVIEAIRHSEKDKNS